MSVRRSSSRRGFTLLEVMIATALTLLMMISLVQVFKIIGDSMKQGRASLQMNNTLRAVTFRLRNDLGNLSTRVDPPLTWGSGGGYLEVFDGSMTDYTANSVSTALSRFGDADDILMFTARAGDSWFTGQIPGVVIGSANPSVTITSQVAEIAVFARPLLDATTGAMVDVDGNLFPDGYQLHYRVLLVRPDLNVSGVLTGVTVPADSATATASAFQVCDLSMHRVYNVGDGLAAGADYMAANNLEELSDPANRFAHYQFPLPGTASATMPLLVLDPIPQTQFGTFSTVDVDPAAAPFVGAKGNFLHRAFVLGGDRQGEDVLATNVLAFDIKGYDSGVPIIQGAGFDGLYGKELIPRPSNPPFSTGIYGEDGSDDVALTPNDPGYPSLIGTNTVIGYGTYVDFMWGRKTVLAGASSSGLLATELSGLNATGTTYSDSLRKSGKVRYTTANLLNPIFLQPSFDTWTSSYESNGTLEADLPGGPGAAGVVAIDQWNRRQGNNAAVDVINAGLPTEIWRRTAIDGGTDGLDNNSTGGIDEPAERETLPPFPVKLRGIKVSIRIEDNGTRQVKQMSVSNEFVTQ